jgi:hypothetical protein
MPVMLLRAELWILGPVSQAAPADNVQKGKRSDRTLIDRMMLTSAGIAEAVRRTAAMRRLQGRGTRT